jgi:AcrR family transcriptional regulator
VRVACSRHGISFGQRSPAALSRAAAVLYSELISSESYSELTGWKRQGLQVARPKSYDRNAALAAARDLFWERGYEATSIADLENCTGLNRSSIYAEFGSKHNLFEAALECYADQVIVLLHEGLRDGEAGLAAAAGLFTRLAELLDCHPVLGTHGCLMVNTIAELAARDERIRPAAAQYRDRVRSDFTAALGRAAVAGDIRADTVNARAQLLAAALMGTWLTVRIDPADARSLCRSIASEILSWPNRDADVAGRHGP